MDAPDAQSPDPPSDRAAGSRTIARVHGYRRHLRGAASAAASAYGYTLTIWSTGAITTDARGLPTTFEAILAAAGAVLAFAIVAGVAYGGPQHVLSSHAVGDVQLFGAFHLPSVGVAIAVITPVAHALDASLVWPLVLFLATGIYLLSLAGQFELARRRQEARAPNDDR